jgi:hypothetical protein
VPAFLYGLFCYHRCQLHWRDALRAGLTFFGYSACGLTLRAVGKADVHFVRRRCRQKKVSKEKATPGAGSHAKAQGCLVLQRCISCDGAHGGWVGKDGIVGFFIRDGFGELLSLRNKMIAISGKGLSGGRGCAMVFLP